MRARRWLLPIAALISVMVCACAQEKRNKVSADGILLTLDRRSETIFELKLTNPKSRQKLCFVASEIPMNDSALGIVATDGNGGAIGTAPNRPFPAGRNTPLTVMPGETLERVFEIRAGAEDAAKIAHLCLQTFHVDCDSAYWAESNAESGIPSQQVHALSGHWAIAGAEVQAQETACPMRLRAYETGRP